MKYYVNSRIHQAIINGESVNDLCKVFSSKEVPLAAIELWGFPWIYECYNEYCKSHNYNFELDKNEYLWYHMLPLPKSEVNKLDEARLQEVKIEDRDNY